MTRTKADLLVLFAALIWGVAFYFQKSAMSHIGPLLFLGLRAILAAAALFGGLEDELHAAAQRGALAGQDAALAADRLDLEGGAYQLALFGRPVTSGPPDPAAVPGR